MSDPASQNGTLTLGGASVPEGARTDLLLAVTESYTGDRLSIPVTVVNGSEPGPVLFATAAVHGDELNGIAIIRDVLATVEPSFLRGALISVPIVNVLGVQFHSRYLPDRRDLNRCFPGSPSGSTASRIAHTLMSEVVAQADAGIDLHTAADRRTNAPQIRAHLHHDQSAELGEAFGAPYLIDAPLREGSLRHAALSHDVPVLTFEGGQALRFEDDVIEVGTAGVLRVMGALGMIDDPPPPPEHPVLTSYRTRWIRADRGGILDLQVAAGDHVTADQPLWTVTGPFGRERNTAASPHDGVIIGTTTLPLVNPGDAVVHIAVMGDEDNGWVPSGDDAGDDDDPEAADDPADDEPGTLPR